FELMAGARHVAPRNVLAAVAEMARAAGEAGMVGGQALDLAAEARAATLAAIRTLHRRKTGAPFTAAVPGGAPVANPPPPPLRRVTTYGEQLGLCFQIADDIADAAGAGDGRTDHVLGKATYPALLGMGRARTHAERARDSALAAVAPLGARATPLRAIAMLVV